MYQTTRFPNHGSLIEQAKRFPTKCRGVQVFQAELDELWHLRQAVKAPSDLAVSINHRSERASLKRI